MGQDSVVAPADNFLMVFIPWISLNIYASNLWLLVDLMAGCKVP